MHRRCLAILLVIGVLLCGAVLPAFAVESGDDAPAPAELAGELYARAVQLFDAGEFEAAAVLFEEAWRFDASAVLAYNAGRAWDRAGDTDAAIDWYTRAAQGGDEAINARVAEALAEIGTREASRPAGTRASGNGRVITGGTLVAFGAAGIGLGAIQGLRAHDRHDAARRADDEASFDARVDEGRRARSLSNASWSVGLVAAGVGTALLVLRGRDGGEVAVRGGLRAATVEVRF